MIHTKELDALTKRFATCVYEPLRITVELWPNSRIVNYDPIHLDGLLARAVVEIATEGHLLADDKEPYWIPLPLKMLWQSDAGLPLWAASVFYPASDIIDDVYVRHKRNAGGWFHNKPKLKTRAGPWMERRIPTPTLVCDRFEARCIGNREIIQALLARFTHIGKLRLGRVKKIAVDQAEYEDFDILFDGKRLLRPIIAESDLLGMWPGLPSPVGWTPPYWKPSLFRPGWRAMLSILDIDFLIAVDNINSS